MSTTGRQHDKGRQLNQDMQWVYPGRLWKNEMCLICDCHQEPVSHSKAPLAAGATGKIPFNLFRPSGLLHVALSLLCLFPSHLSNDFAQNHMPDRGWALSVSSHCHQHNDSRGRDYTTLIQREDWHLPKYMWRYMGKPMYLSLNLAVNLKLLSKQQPLKKSFKHLARA